MPCLIVVTSFIAVGQTHEDVCSVTVVPDSLIDWMDAAAGPCGLSQTRKTGKVEPVDGKIPSGDTESSPGIHSQYSLTRGKRETRVSKHKIEPSSVQPFTKINP